MRTFTRALVNVLCRIPELYSLRISPETQLELREAYPLPGNPIDVACFPEGLVIVSIDATSQTESSGTCEDAEKADVLLRLISTDRGTESESPMTKTLTQLVDSINAQGSFELAAGAEKGVKELLYNMENLRKGVEE